VPAAANYTVTVLEMNEWMLQWNAMQYDVLDDGDLMRQRMAREWH